MNSVNKIYKVFWAGSAFGDNLLAAWVVNVLNFNNISSVFASSPKIQHLVNCRAWKAGADNGHAIPIRLNRSKRKNPNFTILTDLLAHFLQESGEKISLKEIDIGNAPHPLKYSDNPSIKGVDVCLVTETGSWTPYRNWPSFKDLKMLFTKKGISFIDLSMEDIKGNNFLNYVKKSKVYLGLETGASHYAAPFIGDKGLIIQISKNRTPSKVRPMLEKKGLRA